MKIIVYGFLQKKKKHYASFFSWNHESEMINSKVSFTLANINRLQRERNICKYHNRII